MDIHIKELVKDELQFCEELDCVKNEHGVYIYKSSNEVHSFNLPLLLSHYKDWLIDNNIVKGIDIDLENKRYPTDKEIQKRGNDYADGCNHEYSENPLSPYYQCAEDFINGARWLKKYIKKNNEKTKNRTNKKS
jgi:hypothetical protein